MITLQEHMKRVSKISHEKNKGKFSEWAKKGRAFLLKMTPEEKKEYFRKVGAGIKIKNTYKK